MVCIKLVMHIMDKQVVRAVRRRRAHSAEFKRELVARSLEPGVSVAAIAMDNGINANLLFGWRRRHLSSLGAGRSGTAAFARRGAAAGIHRGRAARDLRRCAGAGTSATARERHHRDRDWQCPRSTAWTRRRCQPAQRVDRFAQPRMIGLPSGTRVWLVAGHTDMRKGFDGLAALVQTALAENPFCGHVFVFRGRRGDILKVLWFDGQGLMLLAKRLERGRFIWPQADAGRVALTPAQLSMLLEGIDWRMPRRTHEPQLAA